MRILFLSVMACLFFPFMGRSQTLKQVLDAGDESFQNRDYYNAYRCYETILKYAAKGAYKDDTLKVKFSYAQAAQRLNYFSRAKALYGELSREAQAVDKNIYARSIFNQAKMLQNLAQDSTGYYNLALDTYQFFLSEGLFRDIEGEAVTRDRFRQAAESGIISCDSMRNAPIARTDSLYRLSEPINSGYSELGPVRIGNTLYFSSIRFLPVGIAKPRQSRFFSKQLMATFKEGTGGETGVEAVDSFLVLPKLENYNADNRHTLHTAFSQDDSLMFFTQCVQEKEAIFCSLYLRRQQSDGSWGEPQKLSISAEDKEFTTTQPSIAFDCATGTEWLYFSSDRPGSKGGLDLWRAEIKSDGALGDPENIFAVNTIWNEATPFFHSRSQRLYFSSDAPPGFGEYDIFYSELKKGTWLPPQNMGIPYNSGYNDQYFFLTEDGKQEYFTSDRPRSFRFVEELEFCCTDIYTMGNKVSRAIEVSLEDCDEKYQLTKTVELYELSCGERKLVGQPQAVVGKGTATFDVQLYHKYEVVARSDSSNVIREKQFDLSEEQYVRSDQKITWKPDPFYPTWRDLKVVAYDAATEAVLQGASVSIKAAGMEPVLKSIGMQGALFRIKPDVEYQIIVNGPSQSGSDFAAAQQNSTDPTSPASRPQDYLSDTLRYSYLLSDSVNMLRQCGKDQLEVSLKTRAPDLPLPIVLYFDHDKPSKYRGRADRTGQTFEDAISLYLDNRETFLKNNDPSEERRVNAFFDREVSGGLSTLGNLAKSLLEYVDYMREDEQLIIEIQGYCSPRGDSLYNRLLSKRRIQCVRTYLESYSLDGRELREFVGTKFIVKERPLGESRASSTYPDNDPNSIWGIGPALDRRVEIVDLSTGEELTNLPDDTETQKQEP